MKLSDYVRTSVLTLGGFLAGCSDIDESLFAHYLKTDHPSYVVLAIPGAGAPGDAGPDQDLSYLVKELEAAGYHRASKSGDIGKKGFYEIQPVLGDLVKASLLKWPQQLEQLPEGFDIVYAGDPNGLVDKFEGLEDTYAGVGKTVRTYVAELSEADGNVDFKRMTKD
ncbi:MAG: hypothetical protein KKA90_01155 [Nanoarchaeota archaeon]|nr:hypothetical protein [Nanoarchaeota archaeon]